MRTKIVKIIALIIMMCFSTSVDATPVNWNAIEVNDIEYYVQTDKSTYLLGEDVEMLYRVTNVGQEDAAFWFGASSEWNFWVEKDGQHVWKAYCPTGISFFFILFSRITSVYMVSG